LTSLQSKNMSTDDKRGPKFDYDMPKKRGQYELHPRVYNWLKPSRKLGNGGVLRKTPKLGRLLRWPRYVMLQRQRKILLQRMKIPPALNIFNRGCNKDLARKLVRFCKNYSPESTRQKNIRLKAQAKLQAEGKPIPSAKRETVTYGLGQVMHSIERGEAKIVLIAHDVDPIELVMWMPALCVKKNIPFVIFKSKSRLGALVHKKTVSCLSITATRPEHANDLKSLQRKARHLYNSRYNEHKKQWGKQLQGIKTRHKGEKRKKFRREELAKRKAALQ